MLILQPQVKEGFLFFRLLSFRVFENSLLGPEGVIPFPLSR